MFQVEEPVRTKALRQEGFWVTGRTERRPVYPGVQIGTKNWDEDGEEQAGQNIHDLAI